MNSGRHISKALATSTAASNRVQISSRNPRTVWEAMQSDPTIPKDRLLPPVSVDITNPSTLESAFKDARMVISLVGIMHGSPQDFERIQWKGAENVAIAARNAGAKLVHFSAIGADSTSSIPYVKTKGLAEQSVLQISPEATIIRPSLVFGPEDDFFNRFAKLARVMPFLPVFGGGQSRFQPVYVGDLARLIELISRDDTAVQKALSGKIIEAGGPQVFTYRELMQFILETTGRKRPILSLPFAIGVIQGTILEKFPVNLFTVTRAQVEQLKSDNIVDPQLSDKQLSLQGVLSEFIDRPLRKIHEIVPAYLKS
ncbi:hypothetical protein HYPSUDRAFT_37330 [Hypholoma sublateritium FD-334 SS-4]|uniref:NAD-dependent epimerase/dehydratase domain-containing protein n=1 Tax=Hypholoma sublateritium (strain FD-334 SS-4) TaxID=945553 RepID=A0A0D2MPI1_HYPSF|nr:hypothetical protein HYPSUDRAFT_37330 [Hypholoma sublateritium FD-334 SS-4]